MKYFDYESLMHVYYLLYAFYIQFMIMLVNIYTYPETDTIVKIIIWSYAVQSSCADEDSWELFTCTHPVGKHQWIKYQITNNTYI